MRLPDEPAAPPCTVDRERLAVLLAMAAGRIPIQDLRLGEGRMLDMILAEFGSWETCP